MNKKLLISAVLLLLATAGPALAQSTVTGTLTGGSGGSNTVTGTVTAPSGGGSLSGTVTAQASTGGGGGGGGGGSGSTSTTDYCSNIAGVQNSLTGYVLHSDGTCDPITGTGGIPSTPNTGGAGGTVTPGVPNTGAGGNAAQNLALLTLSGLVALAAMVYATRSGRLV